MAVGKKCLQRIERALQRYNGILQDAKKRDVSESDTVVIIGDMLADVLGYEKYVEVSTEFSVKSTYVDLAVKVGNDVHFLVEAKAIGVDLKDLHVRQAVDYGANQGIEWAILTNGVVWRIYKIEFKKPIAHVLVAEMDLLSGSARAGEAVEFFANLCKEGFAKSQMEEFYQQHQATNKYSLAAILQSELMLNHLRLALRRYFPNVRIETDALAIALRNDVLKRELVDGDDAEAAEQLIKKVIRSAARKRRAKPGLVAPPASPMNVPPPASPPPVASLPTPSSATGIVKT
jgi:hypothetical protein